MILTTAVAVVVVAGGYWMLGGPEGKSTVDFATETVTKGNVSNFITATGTIEPVTEVEVGTQVSGIIDKIYVDYNSVVKKGEYEETVYNFQRAQSALEQSKAALAKAERNLSYATITSPIDGVVTSRDVEEGQTVASGFETPTLFTIAADLTKMQVVADVDEADIAGVEEGARVTFTVDAYPDDVFEGVVRQVRLGSTNSTSSSSSTTTSTIVVTYEVVITADNPYLKLKPRLTANATIYTLTKDNVLTVPNKALRFTPNKDIVGGRKINDCQSSHKVWTLDNNTFTAHPVKIGITDGSKTEIVSGITENTPVVTETVVKGAMPGMEEPSAGEGERSPFMPGPPGSNKKKNK